MPDPSPPPIDAAWQAFRQQGAAMVARERGLTTSCRVKLAGLARSLGIADDQIDDAIRSLGASEPAAPPNPLAEKLRDRLRKDLRGRKSIIGPTIEAQIISAAARKYALDEATTRKIIGEVAAELGLTRITASDALHSITEQIDRSIGRSTWLAREGWDRLRVAGGKWGIDLDVVDELIDERLAANRQLRHRRQNRVRMTIGTLAVLAALGGAIAVIFSVGWPEEQLASSAASRPPPSPAGAAASPPVAVQPEWWDVDLAVDMASAKTRHGGLGGSAEKMASLDAAERAQGYEQLINHVRASQTRGDLVRITAGLVAGSHALDPDDGAAARLRQSLLALLPQADVPIPTQRDQLDLPIWAAETAATSLHREGLSAQRRTALAADLGAALGTTFDPSASRDEHLQQVRTRTALALYEQFTSAATRQPAEVAHLHEALRERVEAWLLPEELARAEVALLAAALPTAGEHWQAYELALIRVFHSEDPLNLLKMLDALRRAEDPALVEVLSGMLLVKTGARPASPAKQDVIRAVQRYIGRTNPEAITAADRWLILKEAAGKALAAADSPTTDRQELLKQSVELAHLTTMAIALAQGEVGFAAFDAGMEDPPKLDLPMASTGATADDDLSDSLMLPPPVRSLNTTERRLLERYLDLIAYPGRENELQRVNGLRGLASFAERLPEITSDQARPLANYLLSRKSEREHGETLPVLATIRRWKYLRLAVADAIPEAKLPPIRLHDIVSALITSTVPDDATPAVMRRMLLENVADELRATSAATRSAGGEAAVFEAAQDALLEIYTQRLRLLSTSAGSTASADTPSEALEKSLALLGSSVGTGGRQGTPGQTSAQIRVARYLGEGDLRQTVALQRLLIELSAERTVRYRPQHAATARSIETEALAASSAPTNPAAENALAQLRHHEAALLKLWMLYAVEA